MTTIHPFPHHYRLGAEYHPGGEVLLQGDGLTSLPTAAPIEFGGSGEHWSPETLLIGALCSCFSLTFRAVASKAQLRWLSLSTRVEGVLEREQGNSQFTRFTLVANLTVPAGTDLDAASRALHKAEQGCLITHSLRGEVSLQANVEHAAEAVAGDAALSS